MHFLIIVFIVLNLGLLSNSFESTECDQSFPNIHSELNKCLQEHQFPRPSVLKIKFYRAFLARSSDFGKQKLFVQNLCNDIQALLQCQINYSVSLSAVCQEIDEDRLIEFYSLQLSITVHRYLCNNNMANILSIFENDTVRLMYRNKELRVCAEHVPNINSIRILNHNLINNNEFCRSLYSSYNCVRNVFETSSNPKLKTINEHVYQLSRDVVRCGNSYHDIKNSWI